WSANKQQFGWERIETNVPLDDSRFSMPGAAPGPQQPAQPPKPVPTTLTSFGASAGDVAFAGTSCPRVIAPASVDSETTSGLGARHIRPAAMSGRAAAIAAVHENNHLTIYVGAASGGVWKSMNG